MAPLILRLVSNYSPSNEDETPAAAEIVFTDSLEALFFS